MILGAATFFATTIPALDASATLRSTAYIYVAYIRYGEVGALNVDSILVRLPNDSTVGCDGNPGTPSLVDSTLYIDASSDNLRDEKARAIQDAILFGREVLIRYDDSTCNIAAVVIR